MTSELAHRPHLAASPDEPGPRRALILAGGGLRLSYQAGAMRALEEAGIRFTHFEGTSGGGINLAMLLSGQSPAEMGRRWRQVPRLDFLALMPLRTYLRPSTTVALGGSEGIRQRALPALGVDFRRIRAAEGVEAWFNVLNYTSKDVEHVPHRELDEDGLVAGMSLPGVLPPVRRGADLYVDTGFVRDASPLEAVRRGAEELWVLWCMADIPEYGGGPVRMYVQTLEMSAVGALHEDIARLREINERIEGGEEVWGHRRPIRLHLVLPPRPLPLDVDLYTGRIDHGTLVDMGYADAVRYLDAMREEGVPLQPEVTRMQVQQRPGVTFRETMRGPFALGPTEPRAGAEAGRAAGTRLAMHATVSIDDMQRFVDDSQHLGELTGHIDFPPFGTGIPATRGVFNLFSPSGQPGLKHMVYELEFRHDGRTYYLAGRKEVRQDAGIDLWADTTTLLTTLHEGSDASGPAVGAGVLSLGGDDLARLVSTMRVTGADSPAQYAEALNAFGRFFMGELWDSYVRPLLRPRRRWRRWLDRARGWVRGLVGR